MQIHIETNHVVILAGCPNRCQCKSLNVSLDITMILSEIAQGDIITISLFQNRYQSCKNCLIINRCSHLGRWYILPNIIILTEYIKNVYKLCSPFSSLRLGRHETSNLFYLYSITVLAGEVTFCFL